MVLRWRKAQQAPMARGAELKGEVLQKLPGLQGVHMAQGSRREMLRAHMAARWVSRTAVGWAPSKGEP